MDFNNYQITPAELRHLLADPTTKPFLQAKLKELHAIFKKSHPNLNPANPESFLLIPEIAFILSAKALELKATLEKANE